MCHSILAVLNNLSPWEIGMIFLIVLLLFGAKRIPELARSLGRSIKEFKKATSNMEDDIRTAMEETPRPPEDRPAPEHTVANGSPAENEDAKADADKASPQTRT